jgi:branched-chain amino acid transport system ATP-binding protein
VLELQSISAGYAEGLVLHDVSLAIRPNVITALIGPNGAGKSTLLKVAAGVLAPRSGAIRRDGVDVTGRSATWHAQHGLCLIPEGRAVYRSLTVRDNLLMQARQCHVSDAAERAVLAFPALAPKMSQLAGTLSGGEQQMLALTAAYVREPAVLLVDEPSLGLAPKIVEAVFEFVVRVQATGMSVLLVDQYIDRVLGVAIDAHVLRRGEIVFSGSAAQLSNSSVVDHYLGDVS